MTDDLDFDDDTQDATDNRIEIPVFDAGEAFEGVNEQDEITDEEVREAHGLNPPPPKPRLPHPYTPFIEAMPDDERPAENISCLRCPAAGWRHRLKANNPKGILQCNCRLYHDITFNSDDGSVAPVDKCEFQLSAEENFNNPKPKLKNGQDMAEPSTEHTP